MATRVRSFSKVNLGLRIGGTRADGFHALTTMYQTIALHDVVTVSARRSVQTRIALTTDHPRVPVDGRNTVWQMVERALGQLGIAAEVEVRLEKRLPIQGGMGAGSANAAAALMGLEREMAGWAVPGPVLGEAERLRVAAEVGSDVPLFLVGGAVLGTGRGELVTAMPDVTLGPGKREMLTAEDAKHAEGTDGPRERVEVDGGSSGAEMGAGVPCVVALPKVGVSTPLAFREWDRVVSKGGVAGLTPVTEVTRLERLSLAYSSAYALSARWGAKPGTSGIVGGHVPVGTSCEVGRGTRDDLAGNTLLALVRTGIENDFEEVVFPYHPSLRETKRLLMGDDSGQPALYAALSGSGSALFGLYRSEGDARAAQRRVRSSGTEALLTETLTRAEYWTRMFADVG